MGRGAGFGGGPFEGNLEGGQEPPGLLGQRAAAHRGGLRHGEVLEGGPALQQHRSQRPPVHGQRRGGLHEHLPNRRAGRLLRRHRRNRRVRNLGRQHGRGASHAVLAPHRPQAGGFQRAPLRRDHPHHPHLRQCRQGAAIRPRQRYRHRERHCELPDSEQPLRPRVRGRSHPVQAGRREHRQRFRGRLRCQRGGQNGGQRGEHHLRAVRRASGPLHAGVRRGSVRRASGRHPRAGRGFRRQVPQGAVALDHGGEPAQPRHLDEPLHLQHPLPHRPLRAARRRRLLPHRAAVRLRHGAGGGHFQPSPSGRLAGGQSPAPSLQRGHLELARRLPGRH